MFNIQTFNTIAKEGLQTFDLEKYTLNANQPADGILLRSYSLHDYTFPDAVKAVARAGAGVNNIPVKDCCEKGIVVFNTPGANANAVKELVLASLFMTARPIIEGATWVQSLAETDIEKIEAEKQAFVGTELLGKRLGVIGLGAIGALVANDALALGMKVIGYDPYVSVDTAWGISKEVARALTLEEVLVTCDYITVHVPLNDNTRAMFNAETLGLMNFHGVLLNFSRGELVDEKAVKELLDEKRLRMYITDFASSYLMKNKRVRILPHLGASTKEAEINCAKMAACELQNYLETGSIKNAVNFPNVEMPYNDYPRISICHKNIPNMVGQITSVLAGYTVNIVDMTNRSKDEYAYTLMDIDKATPVYLEEIKQKLATIEGISRVRVIS